MLQLRFKNKAIKPVWLVDPRTSVGKARTCNISIDDTHLRAHHADITVENDTATLVNLVGDDMVRINGVPVLESREIKHGDIVNLGFTEARLMDTRRQQEDPLSVTAEQQPIEPWVLSPLGTALAGKDFEVLDSIVIGRSQECDIRLGVAHLSRRHAKLTVGPRGLEIEDLKSANGTYVNGQRIARAVIKPGDQVRFDTITFTVSGPQPDLNSTTVRPVVKVPDLKVRQPGAVESGKRSLESGVEPGAHVRSRPEFSSLSGGTAALSAEVNSDSKSWVPVILVIILLTGSAAGYYMLR